MRPIKFRCWDAERSRMTSPFSIHQLADGWLRDTSHGGCGYYGKNFVYMQFTGLTVIGNKELYEGDFIKSINTDTVFRVFWQGDEVDLGDDEWIGGFWAVQHAEGGAISPLSSWALSNFEVIGNIYENPELLKA